MEIGLVGLSFAGGFAVCWFFKDKIVGFVTSVEDQIKAFEAKIADLKAKL